MGKCLHGRHFTKQSFGNRGFNRKTTIFRNFQLLKSKWWFATEAAAHHKLDLVICVTVVLSLALHHDARKYQDYFQNSHKIIG